MATMNDKARETDENDPGEDDGGRVPNVPGVRGAGNGDGTVGLPALDVPESETQPSDAELPPVRYKHVPKPSKQRYRRKFDYLPESMHGAYILKRRLRETSKAKGRYLRALEKHQGRITDACKACKRFDISYHDVKEWRRADERFQQAEAQIREAATEEWRDRDRNAVDRMVRGDNATVVAKAMDSLPEYEKKSTVHQKISGTVEHQHYQLTPEERLELFKNAQEALELRKMEDGSFG